MTTYYCYECKNGHGECIAPCVYTDPIGELPDAAHIKCNINNAIWVREKCDECGREI